ncbi:hypothetical protein CWI38_0189p0020 [Hamiltosporidium tvaerminnensis]|uniref:Uncharacterized protein n=1 Tax=Hamiltosporidium tvaerminnensis TaxID=1176355 RepID=A0A4Q9M1J4_9MICR|nr:hypothetical protein CWI38_0189p0020 [Hamiltosporidium tvaerminnensis]
MSSCNADTEEGQSDRFNERENNDSLEFVFNNFLSYLFETYFVDIQNVIQCKRNKIIGLVDQKILSTFSKREMHFYEMILKVSRMATKKMRFSLANLLKEILENGIRTMQEDLYEIRRIC